MNDWMDARTRRWAIAAVVLGVLAMLALELIEEPEASPLEIAFEVMKIAPVVLTSVGVVLLFRVARRQHDEQLQLIRNLEVARVQGQRWRNESRSLIDGLGKAIEVRFSRWNLTEAEREVALLLLKGLSSKEIAAVRGASERTVREQARDLHQGRSHRPRRAVGVLSRGHAGADRGRSVSRLTRGALCLLAVILPLSACGADSEPDDALREQLTEREDKRRVAEPWSIDLLGRPLTVSGEAELEIEALRGPFTRGRRTSSLRAAGVEIEAFYKLTESVAAFAQLRLAHETERFAAGGSTSSRFVERGEMWLHAKNVGGTPLHAEIGRLQFEDERRWRWNDKLDAVRASYESDGIESTLAMAQGWGRERSDRTAAEVEHRAVRRWIAEGAWSAHKALQLELHALRHDDRSRTEAVGQPVTPQDADESDAHLTWLGVAASGEIGDGRLQYWLDAARVRGNEKLVDSEAGVVDSVARRRVGGWGFDAALRWTRPETRKTRLFAGYAVGSRDFRQTGLQTNEASFGGVKRYPHYGAALDPELSNLRIATLGAGLSLLRSSSIDLVLHHYRQVVGASSLRGARFEPALTGVQRSVGRGFDVVLALEEWDRVEFNLIASVLRAGAAFGALQGKRYAFVATAIRVAF